MIQPVEIALTFVERFCRGDLTGLVELLSPDLEVMGPRLTAGSRDEYLAALDESPSLPGSYSLHSVTEGGTGRVTVFWEHMKPDETLHLSQLFWISEGRIKRMLLTFSHAPSAPR